MMLFLSMNQLRPAMVVGKDVYRKVDQQSIVLIKQGQVLTDWAIEKLSEYEVDGVYIDEELSGSYTIMDDIIDEVKIKSRESLEHIFEQINKSGEFSLEKSMDEANEIVYSFIDLLSQQQKLKVNIASLKNYDDYTFNHSLNVTIISLTMGLFLNLSMDQLRELGVTALFHDIGKMKIPLQIINKPGKLTEDEFSIMKSHAYVQLEDIEQEELIHHSILEGIRAHHERYDGQGYPLGLEQDNIPLNARIIALADVYDALTSKRPYRNPGAPHEALEYMMACSETQFDPELLKVFIQIITPFPVGSVVELSNGKKGTVIEINPRYPMRPVIKLLQEEIELDLVNDLSLLNITVIDVLDEKAMVNS